MQIGDDYSGKTKFGLRFTRGTYTDGSAPVSPKPKRGDRFATRCSAAWRPFHDRFDGTGLSPVKVMVRKVGYRGSVLQLQIWDTAGHERYPAYREYV